MDIESYLIDLDGVLYVGKEPVPGAARLLEMLEEKGYNYRFVSNSTRRQRSSVARRLSEMGFSIPEERIFTPSLAAVERMRREGRKRCYLLTTGDVECDFLGSGITLSDQNVDYVVMGDAGAEMTFERLNAALRLILDGAGLLALERDRYWQEEGGLVLSTGPFVAALEYATGIEADLVGKPSPGFFRMALDDMGAAPEKTAMIGDDVITDVGGAQALGMFGILVRTGKFRPDLVASASVRPDMMIDSIADLAGYLK
ncbi:MAG: TIGR01458 family HAD-type hydrolase [Methanotrichaceae archaeon]|nr:TIGR01458 family HAD-type hydrolase [Methanotrichaceae archaeon]